MQEGSLWILFALRIVHPELGKMPCDYPNIYTVLSLLSPDRCCLSRMSRMREWEKWSRSTRPTEGTWKLKYLRLTVKLHLSRYMAAPRAWTLSQRPSLLAMR